MLKRILFVMALVLSVALTACGGDAPAKAPVTFGQLPVFSGAKVSTEPIMLEAATAINDAMKPQVKSIETKAYDVPAGTTWAAVKSFYSTALEKDGWAVGDAGADASTWTRGTQGIVVKSGGTFIIVALFEAK